MPKNAHAWMTTAFLLCLGEKKKDRPTDLPEFQANRANQSFILLGIIQPISSSFLQSIISKFGNLYSIQLLMDFSLCNPSLFPSWPSATTLLKIYLKQISQPTLHVAFSPTEEITCKTFINLNQKPPLSSIVASFDVSRQPVSWFS